MTAIRGRHIAAATLSYNSLHGFLRNFWTVLNEDPFTDAPHIGYLCGVLEDYARAIVNRYYIDDLIINVPPGSSKSTIVSQMFPAWLWLHAPWAVVIGSSYSNELAVDHAVKSQRIITSDRFRFWFSDIIRAKHGKPLAFLKVTEKNMVNTHNGARISTSTGGTITGKHGHVIIRDDPMKPEEAESDAYRNRANRFNDRTLASRKKDKRITPTITVMQRLHEDDTTGHDLVKGRPVRHVCLPAEESDRVRPAEARELLYRSGLLDPVRMPLPVLDDLRVQLGTYGYAGQFDQAPAPAGGGMLKAAWFPAYAPGMATGVRHFYLDSAYTAKQTGDPSGILGGCRQGSDLLLTSWASVRLEFPDLVRFIPEHMRMNGATAQSSLIIEPKASGLSVIQELRRHTTLNIIEDTLPPGDKVARTASQSATYEAGRVKVPELATWSEGFLEELGVFPVGAHDEAVDCLNGLTRKLLLAGQGRQQGLRGYAV